MNEECIRRSIGNGYVADHHEWVASVIRDEQGDISMEHVVTHWRCRFCLKQVRA